MIEKKLYDALPSFGEYIWHQVLKQTKVGNREIGDMKMTDQEIVIFAVMALVMTIEHTLHRNPMGVLGRDMISQWIREGKITPVAS